MPDLATSSRAAGKLRVFLPRCPLFEIFRTPVPKQTVTEAELLQEELEIDGVRVRTYNEIVEPDNVFVGTQYFRRKWLPLLGCTAWLLILELRQRCYYARKEKDLEERKKKSRDTCKVTLAELGAAIGVSESTVRRALYPKDPEAAALIGEFVLETTTVRRGSVGSASRARRRSHPVSRPATVTLAP